MGKQNAYLYSFAGGQVDNPALARIDLQKMRLAAEVQKNLFCTASGYGFMRPGTAKIEVTANAVSLIPFIRDASTTALLEISAASSTIRILRDDAYITRASVTSAVTNGDFSSATGWTTTGTGAGTAVISGGVLTLDAGALGGIGRCVQQVTTSSAGTEHALRIVVLRGPVRFRCGSTNGSDDYITETSLAAGTHSLAFTPAGSYWVQFENSALFDNIIDSCTVEAAGIVELPCPWAVDDVNLIRTTQSLDVLFVACRGYQQRRVERRGDTSWSIVLYAPTDGPFKALPTKNLRLKPGGYTGNTMLTASRAFFTPDHVGALFRLDHSGQKENISISGDNRWSRPVVVTGISTGNNDRNFTITTTGTWVGSLTIQRSYDAPDAGYHPYGSAYTSNVTSLSISDSDDNSTIYYRIGFAEGDYTSGTVTVLIRYDGGGDYGICRVTGYNSPTSVNIEILRAFSGTTETSEWRESEWSDMQVWPSAVGLFDGRLWWSGNDRIWASISDAYDSFDEEQDGDSAPISRSIAVGLGGQTNWILSLQRLLFGTDGCEASVRASSLDEPITATDFTVRTASTFGSAPVDAVQIDGNGLFVDTSGKRLCEVMFSTSSYDLASTEISYLVRKILGSGIKQIAVQRRPDTRVFIILNDGTAVCLVYIPSQEIAAFIPMDTDGSFDSIAVLPGDEQDVVYFSTTRVIGGVTKHFTERMVLDSEIVPGTTCKVMDCHVSGVNSPASTTLAVGTDHAGASVVVWADGAPYPGPYTVSAEGNVTLGVAVSNWTAGLSYDWQYKSGRLAYAAQGGTPMLQPKRVDHIGIIATDFHRDGVQFGSDFDHLDSLPVIEDGTTAGKIYDGVVYDNITVPFDGTWNTDSRVCLKGQSPYPVKLLGLVITVTADDRI